MAIACLQMKSLRDHETIKVVLHSFSERECEQLNLSICDLVRKEAASLAAHVAIVVCRVGPNQ